MQTILVCLAAQAAQASGGATCNLAEGPVRFSIGTAISRSGGAFFRGGGELRLPGLAVAPDFRLVRFKLENLVHRWLDDGELKLGFYRERTGNAPHGYVSLKIETKAEPDDEGTYRGRYRVRTYDVGKGQEPIIVTQDGAVTCQVE